MSTSMDASAVGCVAGYDPAARISLVVPVRNERIRIPEIVRRIRSAVLPPGVHLEVIVVNDGSDDGTDRILDALEDSTVHVVHHRVPQGKAAAVETAMGKVTGDLVVVHDPDDHAHLDEWHARLEALLQGSLASAS